MSLRHLKHKERKRGRGQENSGPSVRVVTLPRDLPSLSTCFSWDRRGTQTEREQSGAQRSSVVRRGPSVGSL